MAKNIIFCADGTWNGPGEADNDDKSAPASNVFKLFLNLAGDDVPGTMLLAKEQERVFSANGGAPLQIAKYLHGVGDSDNFLVHKLGGGLGMGLITRVVRGYTFVSRNYAAGDKIFLVGFSRGAYTARALGGLIATKGLLDATKVDLSNKEAAYRLGAAAWYQYRIAALKAHEGLLTDLANLALDLPGFFNMAVPIGHLVVAPIEAIAVWDTVGALGIPAYNGKMVRVDLFQFADAKLSTVVRHGVQALAIDERRNDFTPTVWDDDPRVTQALFPGAHADVGGGYTTDGDESGLSDGALQWMTAQLTQLGVQFAPSQTWALKPDCKGSAHQPWNASPFDHLPRGQRAFKSGYSLSRFVVDRIKAGPVVANPGLAPAPYAPANLAAYIAGGVPKTGVPIL